MKKSLIFYICAMMGCLCLSCNDCETEPSPEPSEPYCGNGAIDEGEQCDGTVFGSVSCGLFVPGSFGELKCTSRCFIDISDCKIPSKCGNGQLDEGEFCDGDLIVNNYTCKSIIGPGSEGKLKCDETCLHTDKTECTTPSNCGDGKVSINEKCDPYLDDKERFLCSSIYPNTTDEKRQCTNLCRWDDHECISSETCGNGILDDGEDCDPNLPASFALTCETALGPGSVGYVRCDNLCKFSYSLCSKSESCGNGILENGTKGTPRYHEVCDTDNLNGKTCAHLGSGYTGKLGCLANCTGFDYTNCEAPAN